MHMTTLNISLPDSMQTYIDEQVAAGGYGNTDEYIRQLIRADQEAAAKERLELLLMEGIESEGRIEVTDEYWEKKRAKLLKQNGEA